MVNRDQIIEVLKTVEDPDLLLDIWFMGLVYKIEIEETRVLIEMTLTSPMCPAGPMLIEQVREKVRALGVQEVAVKLVFNPPWTPPEEVKALLGLN